ncbi:MAG: hypothetical protein IPM85_08925 [Chitinophagaceae bacterium]|nr:hypothetical protein [Chitinophagaceae bacterium]
MYMKSLLATVLFVMIFLKDASAQKYNGRFSGEQPGLSSSAEFVVLNNKLKGKVFMNGKQANIDGTVKDSASEGTVFDVEMSITYNYRSVLRGNELHFFIKFPELNDQEVELVMNRERNASITRPATIKSTKTAGAKDARLIGLWRHTEVLSSGSGDNYASFATDYFMEFKTDGTVLSWTGRSGGGSGNVSIEGNGSAKADMGEWYTEGKTLFLIDPVTKQKGSVLFYAEQNRMMLHDGGQ